MHYFLPYYLEKVLKDPNMNQWEMSFLLPCMIGDEAKAENDKMASNQIQVADKNGDGKLSRKEMIAGFKNAKEQQWQ